MDLMNGGIFSRLARVQFTVGYVAVLLAVSCAILMLDPQTRDLVIQDASTNLHNLAHGHIGTLLDSAVVVDAGPLYFWLPFLTCLLVLAELQLHTVRLIVAFLVGHIGATLVVAARGVFSIKPTSALPITAASANSPIALTCSAFESPNPTAIGSFVNRRSRPTNSEASPATFCCVPVIPTREIA